MRATLAASIFVVSSVAGAQALEPGYYGVANVDADDELNVHADPGLAARVVATLAPDTAPLEVVEVRESGGTRWGRIATAEGSGWVWMRYLEPEMLETVLDTSMPAAARCNGTEPFWGLTFEGEKAVLETPLDAAGGTQLTIDRATSALGRNDPALLSFADEAGHALFEHRTCSDGMSEIPYGWTVHLILERHEAGTGPRLMSGCCRVPLPER